MHLAVSIEAQARRGRRLVDSQLLTIAVASVLYTSCLYYSIGGNMNTEVGSFFFFMVRTAGGAGRAAPPG